MQILTRFDVFTISEEKRIRASSFHVITFCDEPQRDSTSGYWYLTFKAPVFSFKEGLKFKWTWFGSLKFSIWYINLTLMSSRASSVCHCSNICFTSQMSIVCAHTSADVHSAVHGTLDVYYRVMSTGSFELLCHAVLNFTYKRMFCEFNVLFLHQETHFSTLYTNCVSGTEN